MSDMPSPTSPFAEVLRQAGDQLLDQTRAVARAAGPTKLRLTKLAGYTIAAPRGLLLDAGLAEPTLEERAEYERQHAESARRRAEQEAKLATAREQLAAITDPLARTVLDLHCRDGHGDCGGCDFSGWEAEPPRWPCETTILIAKHYGIDLPE